MKSKARQQQIRDRLLKLEKATEADMLSVQLDDRAVFLEPWQKLLVQVLSDEAIKDNPQVAQVRESVSQWNARASVDSVGYRLVWSFRNSVINQLSDLIGQASQEDRRRFFARTQSTYRRTVLEDYSRAATAFSRSTL